MTKRGHGAVREGLPLEKPVRTFVAISLPRTMITRLIALQDHLRKTGLRASWPRPETMHLTLRFLGDVAPVKLDTLKKALETGYATCEPVRLALNGAGVFPNRRRPKVVFAEVTVPAGNLAPLRAVADLAAVQAGLPPDNKAFHPHVTLARLRRDRLNAEALARLYHALDDAGTFHAGAIDVSNVSLFSSRLSSGGAVHQVMATYGLG